MKINKSNPGIKFAAGQELQFFSILRERVDQYFETNGISPKGNATMFIKTIVMLTLYLAPLLIVVLLQPAFSISLALWAIAGVWLAGIGMSVMHDANHGAYSEKESVNNFVGMSLNLLGGSVMNWKLQHNLLHHTYTNITGLDEDIDTKLIIRLSPHADKKAVHRHQWFYAFGLYAVLTLYWGLFKDLVQYFQYKRAGLNRQKGMKDVFWLIRISLVKIGYFFVMLGVPMLAGIPTYQVILGFLLMHVVAGLILSVVFQMAHTVEETQFPVPDDKGQMENSWAVHQLKTTMNFSRGNKILSWYIGGLNFQVEHHLFTRICHVHYPAISEIVKETATEFGIPYLEKPTFVEALRSHIRLLKRHGYPSLIEIGG